jgi:hypothetical protein
MYDVVYLDESRHERVLAAGLAREGAVTLARAEARRLRVGRMFLCGSESSPCGKMILIVESRGQRAA